MLFGVTINKSENITMALLLAFAKALFPWLVALLVIEMHYAGSRSTTVVLNLFRALAHFEEPQIFMAKFLAVAHFKRPQIFVAHFDYV